MWGSRGVESWYGGVAVWGSRGIGELWCGRVAVLGSGSVGDSLGAIVNM